MPLAISTRLKPMRQLSKSSSRPSGATSVAVSEYSAGVSGVYSAASITSSVTRAVAAEGLRSVRYSAERRTRDSP